MLPYLHDLWSLFVITENKWKRGLQPPVKLLPHTSNSFIVSRSRGSLHHPRTERFSPTPSALCASQTPSSYIALCVRCYIYEFFLSEPFSHSLHKSFIFNLHPILVYGLMCFLRGDGETFLLLLVSSPFVVFFSLKPLTTVFVSKDTWNAFSVERAPRNFFLLTFIHPVFAFISIIQSFNSCKDFNRELKSICSTGLRAGGIDSKSSWGG